MTALAVFVLDRLTKAVAVGRLSWSESVRILPNIFHLTLVRNTGTAFGMFKDYTTIFVILTVVALSYIAYYIVKSKSLDPALNIALGLIAGGAFGNFIDRVKFGYVVDFLDFRVWPVFNAADSAISVGVAILAWKLLFARGGKGSS